MPHPIHRVVHFDIIGPYRLAIAFSDGTGQNVDFRPVLRGAIFGPLRDLAAFNKVTIDAEAGTLTWPNGADFDPATLHDWPDVCDELVARAREWPETESPHQRANQRMEPTRH
jgi:hypothetical protein